MIVVVSIMVVVAIVIMCFVVIVVVIVVIVIVIISVFSPCYRYRCLLRQPLLRHPLAATEHANGADASLSGGEPIPERRVARRVLLPAEAGSYI